MRAGAGRATPAVKRGARELVAIRIWEHQVPEYEARGWRRAAVRDCTAYDLRGPDWRDVLMVIDGGPVPRSELQDCLDGLADDDGFRAARRRSHARGHQPRA